MRKLFIFFLTIAANSFMLNAQTFKCDKQDNITIDESLMNLSRTDINSSIMTIGKGERWIS